MNLMEDKRFEETANDKLLFTVLVITKLLKSLLPAPRPSYQLPAAVRARIFHGRRTGFAKCAFIRTDHRWAGRRQGLATFFALAFHCQSQGKSPFCRESISMRIDPLTLPFFTAGGHSQALNSRTQSSRLPSCRPPATAALKEACATSRRRWRHRR